MVDGWDLLHALEQIRGDPQAELGAARLYFRTAEFRQKLPASKRPWRPCLTAVFFRHADGGRILDDLTDNDYTDPEIVALVRQIAQGKLVLDCKPPDGKPGPRALAYLKLAHGGTADIETEAEQLLAKTTRQPDVAALEIALVLLGNPKYLKAAHFGPDSPDGDAALEAIRDLNGRAGLDVLVDGGLGSPNEDTQLQSLELLQEITGQSWYDAPRGRDPRPASRPPRTGGASTAPSLSPAAGAADEEEPGLLVDTH